MKTISASDINLHDLKVRFGLQRSDDECFFREWQDDLPDIDNSERSTLDEIKADYIHLSEYGLLEPIVKMVVLSPLLRLAGMYRSPFYLAAEKSVEIVSPDEEVAIKGRLDALIFKPEFWILVIEAKRTQYSLEVGIPQLLAYMLDAPPANKIVFGLVTNGREFQFLKLQRDRAPLYAFSDLFSLYRGRDLNWVLQILKRIASLTVRD